MKTVGITGGIGSGKTTVCRLFEQLGIPVFYADTEAKRLYEDAEVVKQVGQLLGTEVVDNGAVRLDKVAAKVFADPALRSALNQLLHPLVRRRFAEWKEKLPSTVPYCLREAAILIEAGAHKDCDAVILVTAPEEVRIRRVMERDQVSYEAVQARIRAQWSDEEKRKYARFVIVNDQQESLIHQVMAIHQQLVQP